MIRALAVALVVLAKADPRAAYTLPFAMRPWAPPDLVRVDAAIARHAAGTTVASTVTGGVKLHDAVGLYARTALVREGAHVAPANPLVFGLWSPRLGPTTRLPVFAALGLPLALPLDGAVGRHAAAARQQMDGALFATSYLTAALGLGLAHVERGVTIQIEAAVFDLLRLKGSDPEPTRSNFTAGASVGWLAFGVVNVGVEVHWQQWISTPRAVRKDASARDQLTVGGGLRVNVPVFERVLARPGVGWFQAIDDPMARAGYRIVVVDVPVSF